MTLPVQQFPIMTADQMNPIGAFFKSYQQSQMNAADIQQKQLANQLTQVKLKYAEPEEKAALLQAQALPGLTNAQMQAALGQANLANQNAQWVGPQAQAYAAAQFAQAQSARANAGLAAANTNLISQQTPFLAQQEQYKAQLDKFKAQNPLLTLNGYPSIVGTAQYLQNQNQSVPTQQPQSFGMNSNGLPGLGGGAINNPQPNNGIMSPSDAINYANATVSQKLAQAKLYNERANSLAWQQMPADTKQFTIAQAVGMGLDPDTASRRLSQGESLQNIGEAQGFPNPMERPPALFNPTQKDIQTARTSAALKQQINSLSDFTTNSLAPYARRVQGYSPVQVAQAIRGEDPESQARYWAATALAPDLTAARLKFLGGNAGVTLMDDLQQSSMLRFKQFEGFLSPQIFKRANQLIDQQLSTAVNAANKYRTSIGGGQSSAYSGTKSPASSASTADLLKVLQKGNSQ